jgi:hypothetical protein
VIDVPIVIAPNVNPALGRHPRFRQNIADLRDWGLTILWHPAQADPPWMAPWERILKALPRLAQRLQPSR